jgi:hypothetical protein
MITTAELDEMKAMQKRMAELLSRVESTRAICGNCGNNKAGTCVIYHMEIPADGMNATCEKWWFDDIPF